MCPGWIGLGIAGLEELNVKLVSHLLHLLHHKFCVSASEPDRSLRCSILVILSPYGAVLTLAAKSAIKNASSLGDDRRHPSSLVSLGNGDVSFQVKVTVVKGNVICVHR